MERKIGFIGPGKMAGAIINGLIANDFTNPNNIYIYGRSPEKIAYFEEKGCIPCGSIEELNDKCSIIFLCIKPQNFPDVYKILQPVVSNKNLYVSIAAGITFDNIKSNLGDEIKCIRVMPNTPLLVGHGASSICRTENVDDHEYNFVKTVFSSCGTAIDVVEDEINMTIALSGSSPAFIYLFAKTAADYAERHGFDREDARKLFATALIGSGNMLLQREETEAELIEMVSSKGGTTIAGSNALHESGFVEAINAAMDACIKRADELAAGK